MAGTANPNAPATVGVLKQLLNKINPFPDTKAKNGVKEPFSLGRSSLSAMNGGAKMVGSFAKSAASNFVHGHYQESGLANIFGSPRIYNKKSGKWSKRRRKNGKGVSSKSGIGSTDTTRLIKAFKDSLTPLEVSLDGIDGSMSGMRDDIQKLDDNLRKGFLALLRNFNSSAQNPFQTVRNNRQRPIFVRPKAAQAPAPATSKGLLGTLLGGAATMLTGLFGGSGILASALTGLLGVAKSLSSVVRLLTGSTGMLLKFAAALAVPLARGLGAVAGAAGMALGSAGKGIGRSLRRGLAPKPSPAPMPVPEAPKPLPRTAATPEVTPKAPVPRVTAPETVAPKAPVPKAPAPIAEPITPKVPAPVVEPGVRPRGPNGKFLTNDALRAMGIEPPKNSRGSNGKFAKKGAIIPEATTPALEGKPSVTPEVAKPTPTSTPSGQPKPSSFKPSSVIEGTVKEGLKETGKLAPKTTLKGTLAKIGGAPLVIAVEGISGFIEWSKAYDELQEGKITKEEFKQTQSKVIGQAVGGVGGALIGGAIGAALGSVVPVGGTIVGGLVGSVAGSFAGHELGEQLGDAVYSTFQKEHESTPQTVTGTPQEPVQPRSETLEGKTPEMVQGSTPVTPSGSPSWLRRQMDKSRKQLTQEASETDQLMPAPTVHLGVNRMVGQSEQQSNKPMTMPPIVNAPQTTNNYGSGNSGGSSQNRQSPGSSRPTFNSLDFQSMGLGIPGLPG